MLNELLVHCTDKPLNEATTVNQIINIERDRSERSALATAAQPLQDLLDRIIYRIAGLTDAEAKGLEERLSNMLSVR